ncbi:MAG: response regulator [Anaerolineae bacterium]|nr:response regulator [Anaerolineae bacterium]
MNHPIRALVVDDDRSWMEIISEILEDAGFLVDRADRLDMALEMVRNHAHRMAVIDLSLNERDHHNQEGLRMLDELHQRDPGCQALLLTGYATVELAVSAIKQFGATDVLRKETFSRSDFRKLVAKIGSETMTEPAPAPPQAADVPASDAGATEEATRVLIVEDDPGWQEILLEVLGDAGFNVRRCTSFGEALGCLRREKFNLAIVDLSLNPHLSGGQTSRSRPESLEGYRLLAAVRGANTPVIVLSGLTDPVLIEQTFDQQHIFAFLEKQAFNRRIFLQTVNEALRQAGSEGDSLSVLTEREREVLDLLARGLTNKEIGEVLVITTNTVKRHLKSIFTKLDIHTRAAAVNKYKAR